MILWRTALQVFILVITVAWIYTPALNGEFLWDDTFLLSGWAVKSNSWGGLASIWFEPEGVDYFPITYTVLWLEWTAFGTNTFGYHLVNVLLHLSSCFLLLDIAQSFKTPWSMAVCVNLWNPSSVCRKCCMDFRNQKHALVTVFPVNLFVLD